MQASYSRIFRIFTQPPEDWDHAVKEEPLTPESSESQNSDSSPMCSQQTPMVPSFVNDSSLFKVDGSLDMLMAMDRSDFVKVPARDIERLIAEEGDPFQKKAEALKPAELSHRSIPKVPNAFNNQERRKPAPENHLSSPGLSHNAAPPTQKGKRDRHKHSKKYGHILWKFILELLLNPDHQHVICWTGHRLAFRIVNKNLLSQMWSNAKVRQHNISYESITRALRSYKPKPRGNGKPAIISHSIESNFTYIFNEYYQKEISDEAERSFSELLEFARKHAIDTPA